MNASQRLDLESLYSKDVIEIPSLNYLCEFNGSSLPHQSHRFLDHVSMADKVSVEKNSELENTSSVPFGSQSGTKLVDLNFEADECIYESNPSSFESYPSLAGYGLCYWARNSNTEVALLPDYLIYEDNYYFGLKLTFSKSHVQINATAFESRWAFNIKFAVDDLIDIQSQLFQRNATVMMKLCARSRNTNQTSLVSCTSGIEEMMFVVVDPNWSVTMNRITSVNSKYLTVWKTATEVDVEGNEYFSRGTTSYFPNFEMQPFNELEYPKGDPDSVTLSKRDVDLLQPNTYINDALIDFYIQYLKNKIPKDKRSRYHFFNTFFFRKLADLDKDPSSACDGKAAFQRVRKWTRKVNLFEKDYIFIPVNFNLHWSLLVICHPGEVVNLNDNELEKLPRVPCILHMDSVKGYHGGLKNLMQSYLNEEWKERQKNTCGEDLSSRFLNTWFLPVAVPQQQNNYDCGLFLLHNLELFLAEAPLNFNPLNLSKFSNFLNLDWFQPAEAHLKRTAIQRLIFELAKNNGSNEGFSSDDSGDLHCLESNGNSTASHCHVIDGESSTSYSNEEIQMTVMPSSPVLEEFFEPEAAVRTPGYDLNGSMFPMKEVANLNEKEISRLTTSADNVRAESSRGVSSIALSDSDDDVEIIEDLSLQNKIKSLNWKLREINGSTDANVPVYSFIEIPPPSNSIYSENNLSYQEKEAFANIESDTCEEQATKRRRLLPFLIGSDQVLTKSDL